MPKSEREFTNLADERPDAELSSPSAHFVGRVTSGGVAKALRTKLALVVGQECNISTGLMLDDGLGWAPVFAIGAVLELTGAIVFVSYARATPQFI